jgi:hypothetical protein
MILNATGEEFRRSREKLSLPVAQTNEENLDSVNQFLS